MDVLMRRSAGSSMRSDFDQDPFKFQSSNDDCISMKKGLPSDIPLPEDRKTRLLAKIIGSKIQHRAARCLVIGCGTGLEAAHLATDLAAEVVGIDIKSDFSPIAACSA